MPFCPDCKTEYRPGFTSCVECRIPLIDVLEEVEWTNVHTGAAPVVERVEAYLASMRVPYVRLPAEDVALPSGLAGGGGAGSTLLTVAVPAPIYDQFRDEIDRAIHAGRLAAGDVDEDAEAHAEEAYDVRGCPECRFFFSEEYEVCPGDDVDLVPAVEVFEDGQFAPDRVIVADGDGPAADALALALKNAGFDVESFEVEGWDVSAVDVAWSELSARSAEIEAIVAGHTDEA